MLNVPRRGEAAYRRTHRVSHSSDALLYRLVPSSGTRITQPFRPWDHDSLSRSVPPSLRHFPTFTCVCVCIYIYIYIFICTCVCVCGVPPLRFSLSLAVSVQAFHSSFSRFFSVFDVHLRYSRVSSSMYDPALLCRPRTHTQREQRDKGKKEILFFFFFLNDSLN